MLNYKKIILSTTLAMAIIAPTAVYAQPLNNVKPDCKMRVCEKNDAENNCKMGNCEMKDQKITEDKKIDTYEQILQKAEEFVPGTAYKGEEAINNRNELKNEIEDIKTEKTETAILPLKAEFKAEVISIEDKATNGEITKKEARKQLMVVQHVKINEVQDIKDQSPNECKTEKNLIEVKKGEVSQSFENFAAAVKSKDTQTIEYTFSMYIQNSNELEEMLGQLVTQLTA